MDEDRIQGLIRDVARHGESIGANTTGGDVRDRAASASSKGPSGPGRNRRALTALKPFGHAAAIAWFVGIAALVVAAVVLVGVPGSKHSHAQADTTTTTTAPTFPTTTMPPPAPSPTPSQGALSRAVAATDSAGNFDLSFSLTGGTGLASDGLTGSGAADLDPIAMTLNKVAGATLAFGPDNAWEQLGEPEQEYTIPAFAAYADGVVGDTAGALGTFAFCSPTGLFDLSEASIGPTTEVGTATVDGQPTTEYAVTIDPTSFLDAPGISAGESQAMQSAISLLGDSSILDDVYVDASGDIVRTVSNTDGVSLEVDLSNFGGAGTITLPPEQPTIDSRTTLPISSVRNCISTSDSGKAVSGAVTGGAVSTTTTIPPTSETTAETTMTTLTTPTTTQCDYTGGGSPSTTVPSG
jgi:hypothetical protein